MKELGQFLKAEREKQGLSLEDMASRTKIHIQKLNDIEEGNKDALPAKVFCVGLIKSYARELKVDVKTVDQLCQQAFSESTEEDVPAVTPVTKTMPLTNEPEPETEVEDSSIGPFNIPKVAGIGAGVLVCLGLIFAIVQVVEKMNSYSQEEALPQEVFQPVENPEETSAEVVAEENSETSGDQKTEEAPPAMPEPVSPKKEVVETKPPEPKPVPKAEPEVTEKPQPKPEPEAVAEKPEEEDFSEDNFGAPDPSEDAKPNVAVSDNKLTVTALEPVRAEVVWSDGYVQVMLLKSQESKTLVFSKPITLRVNNGGAVQVSFNESEKKVPGTFNQPIEIKYP